jgi:hypothetical protein
MALDPKTSDPQALKTWNKMDFCHLFFCTFAFRLVNPIKVTFHLGAITGGHLGNEDLINYLI